MDTSCTGRDWAHYSLVYREGGYEEEIETSWFLALDISKIDLFSELGEYPEKTRREWKLLQGILTCEGNHHNEWTLFVGKGKVTDTDRPIRTRALKNIVNRIARQTWTSIYFFCFLAKTASRPKITNACLEIAREILTEYKHQTALCGDTLVHKHANEWGERFLQHINSVLVPPTEEAPQLPGYIPITKPR